MSAERDDSVRAAADAVSAGKATKETVDALLGRPHPTADSAIERGPATPEDRFAELARLTSAYMDAPEEAMLRRAFEFARDAHAGQCRKSGEPFIIHPIEVGIILADLRMDAETITAALLHDTVEDTKVTAEEVERTFNPQVRALVEGVTKITRIEVESLTDEQAATIRKMFVAMSKDIRVIVIKLADRLHNMRTLAALREDRRIFKSRETLEIYAPIAHRLGINSIKWELEDLSFFYLEPNKYKQVSRMVTESRAEREKYLADVIAVLHEEMGKVGISAQIMGRPKHLYSIYQKMTKKGKGFSEIYDLIAVRIITSSVKDCYSALGAVHTLWHPMPGRFKDYIAMPKFNMYQSLHTTVMGPAGRPLEVQIRTEEMHRNSEYGVAAHWRYKETGASRPGAAELREATGAPVIASAVDAPLIEEPRDEDLSTRGVPCPVDRTVAHGDVVEVGNMKWKVIATPGHTPGSICLFDIPQFGNHPKGLPVLISGDTLFAGTVGRTDFAGGSMADMRASLKKLAALPDDTAVLPGHNNLTTIGAERRRVFALYGDPE